MTVQDIPFISGMHYVGETFKAEKTISDSRKEEVKVEIIGKYPHFCLVREINDKRVQDRAKWCILWWDLKENYKEKRYAFN
jgi:hypothetical protein